MERDERISLCAEGVGRSVYFVSRTYNQLVGLGLMHEADELVNPLLKLHNLEVQLSKLANGRTLLSCQEQLFDDAGERLPF